MGIDTEIPSGMLWMAMATANRMPVFIEYKEPTNVTKPSGKLWIAIPSAVKIPVLISLGFLLSAFSAMYLWGIKTSIAKIITIPTKNAKFAWRKPISFIDFVRSSTNDTLSITPAENPRVKPKILCVGFFMKNATTAPIVVEMPAKKDNNNANKTTLKFFSPYFIVKATASSLKPLTNIIQQSFV